MKSYSPYRIHRKRISTRRSRTLRDRIITRRSRNYSRHKHRSYSRHRRTFRGGSMAVNPTSVIQSNLAHSVDLSNQALANAYEANLASSTAREYIDIQNQEYNQLHTFKDNNLANLQNLIKNSQPDAISVARGETAAAVHTRISPHISQVPKNNDPTF